MLLNNISSTILNYAKQLEDNNMTLVEKEIKIY